MMQTLIWCCLQLVLSAVGVFLQTTANAKCFEHEGRYGFFAKGNVRMWCASDCLPNEKAERWCPQCCGMTSTTHFPSSWSTSASTTAATSPTHSAQPEVIVLAIALGVALFVFMLAVPIYFLCKKFKGREADNHCVEAGIHLSDVKQPTDDERSDEQQSHMESDGTPPESAQLVATGTSVFARQFSDGS